MDVFFDRLDEATLDRVRAVGLPNQPHFGATTPLAKDLKVKKRTFYPDRVDVTLVWTEPISRNTPISHYLITVTGAVGNNQQPLGLYTPKASPAIMSVPVTPEISGLTFQIQTVLSNGWIQPLAVAPSTGLQIRPGSQNIPTSLKLGGTSITTAGTTIDSFTIPANTLVDNSVVEYNLFADFGLTASGAAQAVAVGLYSGASLLPFVSFEANGSAGNLSGRSKIQFTLYFNRSGSYYASSGTANSAPTMTAVIYCNAIAGSSVIDPSVTNTFDIKAIGHTPVAANTYITPYWRHLTYNLNARF